MDREGLRRIVLKFGTFTTAGSVRGNPKGPLKIGYLCNVTWIKLGRLEVGRGPGARFLFNRAYHPKFGYRIRNGLRWTHWRDGLELEGRPPWENDENYRSSFLR
jgi:hypothetical protein